MANELKERVQRDLATLSKTQEAYVKQLKEAQAEYRKIVAEILAKSPEKARLDELREKEHEIAGLIVTNNGRIEYAEELLESMQELDVRAPAPIGAPIPNGDALPI